MLTKTAARLNGFEGADDRTATKAEPPAPPRPIGQAPAEPQAIEGPQNSAEWDETNEAEVRAQIATEVEGRAEGLDRALARFAKRYRVEEVYKAALTVGLPYLYDPETKRWAPNVAGASTAFVPHS